MAINILGLSIGIACSLLIAIYVINEAGYDKFNEKKDRIFRLVLNGKLGGQEVHRCLYMLLHNRSHHAQGIP